MGATCETVKTDAEGQYIETCPWFIHVTGKHPQSEEIIDKKLCSIAWIPLVSLESTQATRGVHDAICSMRDETLLRQDRAIKAMIDNRGDSNAQDITN